MLVAHYTGGLVPRVAVVVADKPYIVHLVARGCRLLVILAGSYAAVAAVRAFINIVAEEARADEGRTAVEGAFADVGQAGRQNGGFQCGTAGKSTGTDGGYSAGKLCGA